MNRLRNEKQLLQDEFEEALSEDDIDKARLIKTQIEDAKTRLDKAYKKNIRNRNRKKPVLGENEIARVVSGWTKIPVSKITEEETQKLLNLETNLHKKISKV